MTKPPVVVIGAGLTGSAAAWRLAAAGSPVVLVEAVTPAHRGGSSHGSARIFRHAYTDPFYVDLTVRALAGWRLLERMSGVQLLTVTGGLDFGDRRDVPSIDRALDAVGVPHEVLDAAEARTRWPQFAFTGPVLHHAGAGVIDAEHAVDAMVALARAAGAESVCGDAVVAISERRDGVAVELLSGRVVLASVVVVAVGAWLPKFIGLLPEELASRIPGVTVTERQVVHFPFPGEVGDPGDWPVFIDEGELSVYALPGGRDADGLGFKIAEHDGGAPTSTAERTGSVTSEARDRLVDYVQRTLPGIDPTPYAETTCLYTSTDDEDFVIDREGRIVIASPCSGHGAKFAPLIGEMVADAALDRADALPARFRFPRDELVGRSAVSR